MSYKTVELSYEQLDRIVWKTLEETRDNLTKDLGANNNVFVFGDPEADDIEIQKAIDAFDLVIDWYVPLVQDSRSPGIFQESNPIT